MFSDRVLQDFQNCLYTIRQLVPYALYEEDSRYRQHIHRSSMQELMLHVEYKARTTERAQNQVNTLEVSHSLWIFSKKELDQLLTRNHELGGDSVLLTMQDKETNG